MENIDVKQYKGLDSIGVMAKLLLELGKINESIVILGSDIFAGGALFKGQFPNRTFNFGIAESNMISAAAGFSAFGKIPCAEIMGCITIRAAEQIRDDVCYNNHNVKIFTNGCGVNMAPGGVTHHDDTDISILRSFPNITIIQPSSPKELLFLAYEAIIDLKGPVYLRLSRGTVKEIYESDDLKLKIGKAVTLKEGDDVTLIASGLPVQLALKAEEVLLKEGIKARIINIHTIKPIDQEIIIKAAKETKGIITIEDGSVAGGLGAAVASIAGSNYPTIIKQIGFPMDRFTVVGPSEEVLWDYFGINIESIVKEAKNILALKR